mmetsp:Transcript_9663/g.29347  ORF Transcript_9663/g.29347 Transcript_9663/m.29347 type:complete len:372 (-) Transcript_9663:3218-4333(-)
MEERRVAWRRGKMEMAGFVSGVVLGGGSFAGRRVEVQRRRSSAKWSAVATQKVTQLEQLKKYTVIVEDTGDIETIRKHKPMDATTNPSLIYKAAGMEQYSGLVSESISYAKKCASTKDSQLVIARDKLSTLFGAEITKVVPGYVSTEVDARLSFDTESSIKKAYELLKMYEEVGVPKERILIKLASTWEGLKACEVLQKDGINCNMTLMFSLAQAAVAAEYGAKLVSPFVGRILDWYKKATGTKEYAPQEDPGVVSVQNIYKYYKCHGYDTIVMGASFRNLGEILELAGCDRLTISPQFIDEMESSFSDVEPHLHKPVSEECELQTKVPTDEVSFRWLMNEDQMATEKLSEGIRGFAKDSRALDKRLMGLL